MDNENINYSDYKYDFESKIVMNEQDYLDFNNVSYKRLAIIFIIEFIITGFITTQISSIFNCLKYLIFRDF